MNARSFVSVLSLLAVLGTRSVGVETDGAPPPGKARCIFPPAEAQVYRFLEVLARGASVEDALGSLLSTREGLRSGEDVLRLELSSFREEGEHPAIAGVGEARWQGTRLADRIEVAAPGETLWLLPGRASSGSMGVVAGRVEGAGGGEFLLLLDDCGHPASASILTAGREYQVLGPRVTEIRPALVPGCALEPASSSADVIPAPGGPGVFTKPFRAARAPKTVLTLLAAYSAEARASLDPNNAQNATALMRQAIDQAVAWTNQAFDNSEANAEVHVVGTLEVGNYDTTPRDSKMVINDLINSGTFTTLRNTRFNLGADLVTFFVKGFSDNFAGRAYVLTDLVRAYTKYGYSAVMLGYASSNFTLAHEIGHNLGCGHAPGDSADPSLDLGMFPDSHGYHQGTFADLMAYAKPTEFRLDAYSNPDVLYQLPGQAAASPIGNEGEANNAGTINATMGTVASYLPDKALRANAGPDQVLLYAQGLQIRLDGSKSRPPTAGVIRTYQWLNLGTNGSVGSSDVVNYPVFSIGRYDFRLTVTGTVAGLPDQVDTDQVTVFVVPFRCPIADAGEDQVVTGSEFVLDARGSWDPDRRIVQYQWFLNGAAQAFVTSMHPRVTVSSSSPPFGPGDYVVYLQPQVDMSGLDAAHFNDLSVLCGTTDSVKIHIQDPQAIVSVPDDFPTIQDAIDASQDGDVVLVRPGTYTGVGNRDISFHSKQILVRGEMGAAATIIDCSDTVNTGMASWHRGFIFTATETNLSILQGFTIMNGKIGTRTSIANSINTLKQQAGNGDPAAKAALLDYNARIQSLHGGGILVAGHSAPVLRDLVLHHNQAQFDGGGIALVDYASPTLNIRRVERCRLYQNTARYGNGGGISILAEWYKGARGLTRITDCLLYQNKAVIDGTVVSYLSENGDSVVGGWGGGISVRNSTTFIINNTVTANTALVGGGVALRSPTFGLTLTNGIVWKNTVTPTTGPGPQIYPATSAELTVTYSDVGIPAGVFSGDGNINIDPGFRSPNTDPPDYRLKRVLVGPIDAADGNHASRIDLDKNPRVDETTIVDRGIGSPTYADMGAYEFQVVGPFIRGDVNMSGRTTDLADVVTLLGLFDGGTVPCLAACDANGDGKVDLSDSVALIAYFFQGTGKPPVAPYPACGLGLLSTDAMLGCENPLTGCSY